MEGPRGWGYIYSQKYIHGSPWYTQTEVGGPKSLSVDTKSVLKGMCPE